MDTSVFTYVIDYNVFEAQNPGNRANDLMVTLRGLPNDQRFYCEVVNFMINTETLAAGIPSYLTMTIDSFIETGFMTNNRLDILCQMKTNEGGLKMAGNCFEVDNFNGKSFRVQMVSPDGSTVANNLIDVGGVTTWQITLRMKPIK